jgi:hypothetical protein
MQFLIAGVVPAKIIRSDPRNAVCLFKEITAGIKRSGDGGGGRERGNACIDAASARLMRSLSVAGDVCRDIANPTLFFSSRRLRADSES